MLETNSNLSDPALPYLSQVLDVTALNKGMLNIIVAPCHSGKTTATSKIIEEHARCPERVLYLIDTSAGKQALITHNEAQRYTAMWLRDIKHEWWGELKSGDGFRVMTYHQFGIEVQKYPDFTSSLDLIICDEMHNLIKYMGIEYGNNAKNKTLNTPFQVNTCHTAFATLCTASISTAGALLVVLTANPNSLVAKLDENHSPFQILNYTDKVRSDRTKQVSYYTDLEAVIRSLHQDQKAIIYISRIDLMLDCAKQLEQCGRTVCCLWGKQNEKRKMSDWQLSIRDSILQSGQIPEKIDTLLINAAYETSINIYDTRFNTMIVHTKDPDVQTQVRGRLRHNIDDLFLYDKDHLNIADYFPPEYLDRYLFVEDTRIITAQMNLHNDKGRELKWPSILRALANDGMFVLKDKKHGKRCCLISRSPISKKRTSQSASSKVVHDQEVSA